MTDSFLIKQQFTLLEYLSASFYLMARLKIIKRLFLICSIFSLLSGILDFTLSEQNTMSLLFAILKAFYLPVFLILFFGIGMTIFSIVLYKLKPKVFKGTEYKFNHWGMEKTGSDIDTPVSWSKIIKYNESSKFIFLFLNNNHAHIVQKRMFDNSIDLENFKDFIETRIQRK